MNALSTLYLFSSIYPMTVSNVVGSMSYCSDASAFLSVPYILKLLAEDPRGMRLLQRMELVSTGGAPLPEAGECYACFLAKFAESLDVIVGDEMVEKGVELVSRLGSSECGFLMSSQRDYATDREWSWLRNSVPGQKMLVFEPVSDSEYELVVPKAWSTRVVSNREDGSFATGDLYTKHPAIPHAWRYCGRVDDVIVMTNGKKASANPIETALRASPLISEAVVFGASQPALGVLIVPASSETKEDAVRAYMRDVNANSASYAQIPDALVVVLPSDSSLPKTSKGSIVRPRALVQYASVVEEAYRRFEQGARDDDSPAVEDVDVKDYIRRVIRDALWSRNSAKITEIDDDADLFALGVDSVQAIGVRSKLNKLVPPDRSLGTNVVFEYPSISQLVVLVQELRSGRSTIEDSCADTQRQYLKMRELLDAYSTFADITENITQVIPSAHGPDIIVLTGTTGALGAHVLSQLVQTTSNVIVALVRAENDIEAKARVEASLQRRKLSPVDIQAGFVSITASRVVALAAKLTEDMLGLESSVYTLLVARLHCVMHIGWPVNFALSLDSFASILRATQNLIILASHSSRGRFVFCSSMAAVSGDNGDNTHIIMESLPCTEASAAAMGYSRSKWVAEHICARACHGTLKNRVTIARIGQLCGDTVHGVWNEGEAWPLMIASARYTRCLPDLPEDLSWLPVDVAARLIIHISAYAASAEAQVPVYHVVNPVTTSWADIVRSLRACGYAFECVGAGEWIKRLRAREAELDGATRNLIAMWESKVRELPINLRDGKRLTL
ncbi:hypothetical protein EIP86_005400 [Pleurotus ostreatoroseus]|nr:hypothetical protein EIP86_005400 [Pleurotus ostreatoroseus]